MISGSRQLDVDHGEGRATGDGEGGLHPLHIQEHLYQRRDAGNISWHILQDDPGGSTGRGSAT